MSDHDATPYDYDLAVIGGGSGGYAAARTAVAEGLKTVVIEGGDEVGGLCILRGCMPTKALLYASEVAHLARQASTWGVEIPEVRIDLAKAMARKDEMIREFADYRREQLTDGRFQFIRDTASFEDAHTLRLAGGDRLTARHFIISTGSRISPSPIPDLDAVDCLTSDAALKLTQLPESIIVLGGGPIALEFAQFFARFGVKTTVIQRSPQLLKTFDADAAQALTEALEHEGIRVLAGTRLLSASRTNAGKTVRFAHEGREIEISAEEIFNGLGRSPNTGTLNLEGIGVELESSGHIKTSPEMRTTAPHIYAAGDCAGPHEVVHIAIQQGEIAAHNIARPDRPKTIDYRVISSIVFTDPQAAQVGLTEREATSRGIPFLADSYPFDDHGKSLIMEARHGFVKLIAHKETGEILGGACVGPMGGDLLHEIIVAMQARMTVRQLAETPHYHPTLAEIWTYPAEELADRIPL